MNVEMVVHIDGVSNNDLTDGSNIENFEFDLKESVRNLLQSHMGIDYEDFAVGFFYTDPDGK